ncbi:SMP-30/gluconolactonase/LRE family protein [Kibdelosporangium phytohabitans]|uniref:SMP-30/Gluconolactonase/LRE-like region domain-containing protein n=1 Tax=Kibdelosporangium phytohabitans TaxID=860235 RepID=A0A0N9I1Z3_9PSEU|nr:SMP-30/gluconolactonase/LRE family protein [Kibdelosporangium phytohabitans]ALG08443.1 hypothetical protein AOZ06_17335 [Kibdelosporangium phytohabitans]MBE1470505.1 gluconolactonase [Kibdelosporangium phytohabitans]
MRTGRTTGPRSHFAPLGGTDGGTIDGGTIDCGTIDCGTIDCAGNVCQVTYGDGKVNVFSPAGRSLGTISAGRNATNAAFGGPDGKTPYITSGTQSNDGNSGNLGLYSIRPNVPGWPY